MTAVRGAAHRPDASGHCRPAGHHQQAPAPVTGGRLRGWSQFVPKLRQASGVDFHSHDLRRTARTLISRLGVPEDIAELAIGHVRADLIARYNKDQAWEGRSDAFARVSATSPP